LQFLLWFLVQFSSSGGCEWVNKLLWVYVHVPSSKHS
jgi:hypothetical protein